MTDTGSPDPSGGLPASAIGGPGPSDPPSGPDAAEPPALAGVDALLAIESQLAAVDAALARLDDGIYGSCRLCGATIDDDRLAADPTADTCATHEGDAISPVPPLGGIDSVIGGPAGSI